jgi:hypothetical protein
VRPSVLVQAAGAEHIPLDVPVRTPLLRRADTARDLTPATVSGAEADQVVRRLIGVYDADGSVRGELAYWVGARLGRAHCALCDITHGLARPRREWNACREQLPVPFDTYHRDDQPDEVRTASSGQLPVVAAETSGGVVVVLLGPRELAACRGSAHALEHAVQHAVVDHGLQWPSL